MAELKASTISGNCNVSGNLRCTENVTISGNCNILGDFGCTKNATISGNCNVSGNFSAGNTTISGNCDVTGDFGCTKNATISGNVSADRYIGNGVANTITSGSINDIITINALYSWNGNRSETVSSNLKYHANGTIASVFEGSAFYVNTPNDIIGTFMGFNNSIPNNTINSGRIGLRLNTVNTKNVIFPNKTGGLFSTGELKITFYDILNGSYILKWDNPSVGYSSISYDGDTLFRNEDWKSSGFTIGVRNVPLLLNKTKVYIEDENYDGVTFTGPNAEARSVLDKYLAPILITAEDAAYSPGVFMDFPEFYTNTYLPNRKKLESNISSIKNRTYYRISCINGNRFFSFIAERRNINSIGENVSLSSTLGSNNSNRFPATGHYKENNNDVYISALYGNGNAIAVSSNNTVFEISASNFTTINAIRIDGIEL